MSSNTLTMYHVSFVYQDMRGSEQFTEHTVSASDEDAALSMAENRPAAPDDYDRAEVRPI